MSLRCWTCDGRRPSALGFGLCRSRPCVWAAVQWLRRERRGAARGVDPYLDAGLQERIHGEVPVDHPVVLGL
eukprot:375046-Alexandrium_andersonii.AAC.1